MDIKTLLVIDILVIIAIPISVLFINTIFGIVAALLLTVGLMYLDTLTFQEIRKYKTHLTKDQ